MTKSAVESETEKNSFISELVEEIKKNKEKPIEIRKFYVANKERISDYQAFSSELFNYVLNNGVVIDYKAIMRMSDILYQMNLAIDKEIQFYNLIATIAASVASNS